MIARERCTSRSPEYGPHHRGVYACPTQIGIATGYAQIADSDTSKRSSTYMLGRRGTRQAPRMPTAARSCGGRPAVI